MKKALIVVDYSNDFVAENGNLTCGEPGQVIEDNIFSKIDSYNKNDENIFYLMRIENDVKCLALIEHKRAHREQSEGRRRLTKTI
mgnify:CR=1 FL=1